MRDCKKCGKALFLTEGYVTVITEIETKTRATKHTDYFHLGCHEETKDLKL